MEKKEINKKAIEYAHEFIDTGSEKSFTKLFNLLYPYFRHILKKYYVKDNDLVNDILSSTFESIYNSREKLEKDKNVFNYMYTIMVNHTYWYLGHRNKNLFK